MVYFGVRARLITVWCYYMENASYLFVSCDYTRTEFVIVLLGTAFGILSNC